MKTLKIESKNLLIIIFNLYCPYQLISARMEVNTDNNSTVMDIDMDEGMFKLKSMKYLIFIHHAKTKLTKHAPT